MEAEGLAMDLAEGDENVVVGFADLRGLLHADFKGYGYGVLVGRRLEDRVVDSILAGRSPGPTALYEAHYRETNAALSEMVARIAGSLNAAGISALAIEPTVSQERLDGEYGGTLRTKLSHKMVATRAGLGWIGKTALFVSKRFGPRLRLATVLTESPAGRPAEPVEESGCGSCSLCVAWCPAQAATGKHWSAGVDRDAFFDPFKCRETCLALSEARLAKRTTICGICMAVCPVRGGNTR
jgi:ferredoxin